MFYNKLFLTIVLALAAGFLTPYSALALDYSGSQGNPATFETLEETRASSPAAVAHLETNNGKTFKSHPVLDGYPKGTTYVYRSANLFGGRAAARLNTNILVFAEKSFQGKDDALAYLKSLDLIRIIDEAIGSVVLVTPSDPKAGFTAGDQKYYYALQTAMLAQKASERSGKTMTYYSDAEYFGGYGYTYVIGIDGGATFLNNYVAGTFDYVSRIAGMLLINGKMDKIRQVAALVPVYLVNAPDAVIEKYEKVNDVDVPSRAKMASRHTSTRHSRSGESPSSKRPETRRSPDTSGTPTTTCLSRLCGRPSSSRGCTPRPLRIRDTTSIRLHIHYAAEMPLLTV